MLYEKKMLILSGDGKGVVLIEKSAHGVKFALRTFDMPPCAPLKAGVITKTAVYVRDLPYRDDPAAVFTLDIDRLDDLHFAVFDRELRLYGCIGKRMWEANLMDLLNKHERRAPMLDGVPHAALPPIASQPRVLPMADGTGIPQSRLSVYGDDALADNDFYTRIDMSARMPVVDSFLSAPRVLDGLAPRVRPRALDESADDRAAQAETATVDVEISDGAETSSVAPEPEIAPEQPDPVASSAKASEPESDAESDRAADASVVADEYSAELGELEEDIVTSSAAEGVFAEPANGAEAAPALTETVDDGADVQAAVAATAEMPWEQTARWIKKRGGRDLAVRRPHVRQLTAADKVKHLRSTEFFERARHDIDVLFASAQKDESLVGMLDDVEWVKVDVDGNTISVGRSGNVFLCYAVAGMYESVPPLGDESQWLPVDKGMPTGKGYWLVFQNMQTGEIIKS